MPGDVDGVGSAAQIAAMLIATDGHAVYFTNVGGGSGVGRGKLPDPVGTDDRELDLSNNSVTTMVGTHGAWTARPGVGFAQAAVNSPQGIAFDSASHSLLVVDGAEEVLYRIK